ncbi:hypothetical protein [Neobacillus drentensis]|uniref:hypothetical protein n=1 Tax=Neobacillus drentensis TaxID=220684 RepID=UPI002FFFDB2D
MENHIGFLNRLEQVTEGLDEVTKAIRLSEADQKLKVKNWIITWLIIPFHSLTDFKSIFKGIKKLDLSPALPIVTGTSLYPIIHWAIGVDWGTLAYWIFPIAYLISIIFIAPKTMCRFDSGYFRINAYSIFRNQEYELFKTALAEGDEFYFSTIPKSLQVVLTDNQHVKSIHTRIDNYLNQERTNLEALVKSKEELYKEKKEEYKDAIKAYDKKVDDLVKKYQEALVGIKYLVEFLKSTNTALYRKKNQCFTISDIVNMVSAGVTIYELDEEREQLHKIYDQGTTGASPTTISVDEPYATARVVLSEENAVEIDEPSEGRFVVSRLFKMGYNTTWVINFHTDITQEKALFLTVSNDLLNTQEVMRMIHAMCLLKQESDYLKGEIHNANIV